MNEKNIMTLNIESNAFAAMKEDFNKVLKRTLSNMQAKESDAATLTLKLGITLTEMEVPDFSGNGAGTRTIHNPRCDHKINSVMQIKTEESGSLKGEYELVWDEDAQDFIMRPIDNGQQSMFDGDVYEADYEIVSEQACLPDSQPKLGTPDDDYNYDEPDEED